MSPLLWSDYGYSESASRSSRNSRTIKNSFSCWEGFSEEFIFLNKARE